MFFERNITVSSYSFWKAHCHVCVFIRNGTGVKSLDGDDWVLYWFLILLRLLGLELSEFTDVCATK